MIILATAIIITLSNSGIIEKANEAVDKTNEAQIRQIAQLGWAEAYAEYGDNVDKLTKGVEDALTANGINPDDYEITVTKTGVTLTKAEKVELVETEVPAEWKTNVAKIINGVPIPEGFVASSVAGETTKDTGLVIYEGEEAVTTKNHYDALRTRNQYVWVPVPDFSKFVRRTFGINVVLADGKDQSIDLAPGFDTTNVYYEAVLDENNMPTSGIVGIYSSYDGGINGDESDEIKSMYASVKKYGGFYVARYEGSKDENNKAASLMNARQTYTATYSSRGGVTETLIYGVQWDTTIQWILDSGLTLSGYSLTDKLLTDDLNKGAMYGTFKCLRDCTDDELKDGWFCGGDYYCFSRTISEYKAITSGKSQGIEWYLSTGALKTTKLNNIYDLLGNYKEHTNEKYGYAYGEGSSTIRDGKDRGGYIGNGVSCWANDVEGAWGNLSYRSALYINN